MLRLILCLSLFSGTEPAGFSQTPAVLPFRNTSLPVHARAVDLVSRMTLAEKVSQMGNAAAAVPRLGVPAYDYWNEGLHGVARAGYATMFPQAIGMAATFDPPLLRRIGDVISTEARAKNNEALRRGNHDIYFGLTFWSPNINIFRDPRWGRGQETYGEDPFLTGALGVSFIRGLQGDDPHYYKVIATPKHFAVHSGPESDRHRFNVAPSAHDLWDTYLPQFRAAIVDAKGDSIMCAYNAIDGTPACGSKFLLQDVLRDRWKFQGFVTSDCGAVDDFFKPKTHGVAADAEHADRDALLAGTDTNCGNTYQRLGNTVQAGLLREADIDTSLVRLMEARIRLGQFDPALIVPYTGIPIDEVHTPDHVAVARKAAEESMVLLKNDGVLPLNTQRALRVAVVGPNAAALSSLEGNYNGTPHTPTLPVDAIAAALPHATVIYAAGAPLADGFTMPVPRSLVRPNAGATAGWHAEYFDRPNFTGKPAQVRNDPEIDFDWNGVNPLHIESTGGFAVRWSGALTMPQGEYTFRVVAGPCRGCATEQKFRVLVDGKQVAASPQVGAPTGPTHINGTMGLPEEAQSLTPEFHIAFRPGEQHAVQVEFVRNFGQRGSGITLQFTPPQGVLLPEAIAVAHKADVIVAMLGLSPRLEGEEMRVNLPGFSGGDRTDITLPAAQEKLLQRLLETGRPVVVVLLNGSALAVNTADERANAVLEAWYPGEAGGQAIAQVLTGAVNPSGRLPVTFYHSVADLPDFADYSMRNRTYRYFAGQPLYGFGYGLSYTHFRYGRVTLSRQTMQAGDSLTATATIANDGQRAGEEVVQLYVLPPAKGNGGLSPHQRLAGVQRVKLKPGQQQTVRFTLDPRLLSEVDAAGKRAVMGGTYRIAIGGAQPGDAKAPTPSRVVPLVIKGSQPIPD